jgi:hypothetical protein
VSVSGQLATATGAPVANQRVWLIERLVGQDAADVVAMGLTGNGGAVDLTSPALTHSARLRLVTAHGLRSAALTVVVVPTVNATVTAEGPVDDVAITTVGGNPGDTVVLQRHVSGGWQGLSTATLDGAGSASFSVPAPPKHPHRFRVVLLRTKAHAAARSGFVLSPV